MAAQAGANHYNMVAEDAAPDCAQALLDLFVVGTPASLLTIQAAAQSDDKSLSQRLLHTLKSSSASVGAVPSNLLTADSEVVLRQGHKPLAALHSRLHRSFEAFKKATAIEI